MENPTTAIISYGKKTVNVLRRNARFNWLNLLCKRLTVRSIYVPWDKAIPEVKLEAVR